VYRCLTMCCRLDCAPLTQDYSCLKFLQWKQRLLLTGYSAVYSRSRSPSFQTCVVCPSGLDWKLCAPLKRRSTSTRLHSAVSQTVSVGPGTLYRWRSVPVAAPHRGHPGAADTWRRGAMWAVGGQNLPQEGTQQDLNTWSPSPAVTPLSSRDVAACYVIQGLPASGSRPASWSRFLNINSRAQTLPCR
jgi:hypothetical protein